MRSECSPQAAGGTCGGGSVATDAIIFQAEQESPEQGAVLMATISNQIDQLQPATAEEERQVESMQKSVERTTSAIMKKLQQRKSNALTQRNSRIYKIAIKEGRILEGAMDPELAHLAGGTNKSRNAAVGQSFGKTLRE